MGAEVNTQEGPTAVEIKRTVWQCLDCKWHERRRVGLKESWHTDYYCHHPELSECLPLCWDDETPDWCPVLAKRETA